MPLFSSFGTRNAVVIALAAFVLYLATSHLTESPPTWFDEGQLIQIALNQSLHGVSVVQQVAPGELASAALSGTTGYTVTLPIAAAFKIFGADLLVARSVMVVFLVLYVFSAWRLIRNEPLSLYALALLATFAPLYGNGKNVLGEIPGLFFLVCFLLCVRRIEHNGDGRLFLAAGLFLGLAVATKPPFLLVLPSIALVALFSRHLLSVRHVAIGFLGFLTPVLFWVYVQFGGQSLSEIYSFYSNPYVIDVVATIKNNIILFLTKPQPLYALGLLGVWALSVLIRYRRKVSVSRAEYIALGFSLTIYLAFLRLTPHYRYFFLGEILALIYFPAALYHLWSRTAPRILYHALLVALIAYQVYLCFFGSWIAAYSTSHRTQELREVLSALPSESTIFVYHAPEAVIFLQEGMLYYQYVHPTPTVVFGEDKLPLISAGIPDYMISLTENVAALDLAQYTEEKKFNRYSLFQKRVTTSPDGI